MLSLRQYWTNTTTKVVDSRPGRWPVPSAAAHAYWEPKIYEADVAFLIVYPIRLSAFFDAGPVKHVGTRPTVCTAQMVQGRICQANHRL